MAQDIWVAHGALAPRPPSPAFPAPAFPAYPPFLEFYWGRSPLSRILFGGVLALSCSTWHQSPSPPSVWLAIKFKETFRTSLSQRGAKVSLTLMKWCLADKRVSRIELSRNSGHLTFHFSSNAHAIGLRLGSLGKAWCL